MKEYFEENVSFWRVLRFWILGATIGWNHAKRNAIYVGTKVTFGYHDTVYTIIDVPEIYKFTYSGKSDKCGMQ